MNIPYVTDLLLCPFIGASRWSLWLCLFMAVVPSASYASVPTLRAERLRCEFRENPLGIGELRPRLDWRTVTDDVSVRGQTQGAYRILVASSPALLDSGRGDLWDSGRVESGQSTQIVYGGTILEPRHDAWWKVLVWGREGREGRWSETAHWSRGLRDSDDWTGKWIGLDAELPSDGSVLSEEQQRRFADLKWMSTTLKPSNTGPVTAFVRKTFSVSQARALVRATLLTTVDQRARIVVNGRLLGEIARWERARPLDLTTFMTPGENVLGLELTQDDGCPPAIVAEIELVYADRTVERIVADPTWLFSTPDKKGDNKAKDEQGGWQPLVSIQGGRSPWGGSPQTAGHALLPVPFLRSEFDVGKQVARATLYATAFGLYEIHLNGKRVGPSQLAPGWTDYSRRVQYQTYDVSALVHQGRNALGTLLGDGWFAGTLGGTGHRYAYGAYPRVRVELEIQYADGTKKTVGSDRRWKASYGPILHADLQQGCAYDARKEMPGWDLPGYDDSGWRQVSVGLRLRDPAGPLTVQRTVVEAGNLEPARVIEDLPALVVTPQAQGSYLVDFGQNLVGWVRLKVRGKSGQKIVLRHGEMLNANGSLYTSNLRGAAAVDTYWLKGGELETLEPRFTFHGFRYVEVTGLDAAPGPDDFTAVVLHTPLERTGDFSCSDDDVNKLFRNILWGQKGNYVDVPTDCPQRDERLGWAGDTQVFARTGLYNFDGAAFLERWLVTMIEDSQAADGSFADVAPVLPHRKGRVSTAWGDAAILCTYVLWTQYADTRVIERHFDALCRYMAFLEARARNGVLKLGGYGDWLHKGGTAKDEVIDTAYYAYLCSQMSEMAEAIGRSRDAARYAAQAATVKEAFRSSFILPDGSIQDSGQTGYALAFTMGLVPNDLKKEMSAKYVASLEANDWHLATGFIGTPRLLPGLSEAGRDDVAYRVLLQRSYPSWLYQVRLGATTMWERWDGWRPEEGFQTVNMNSFNHYAFGAVAEYLYCQVAGIATEGPGFRRVIVRPRPRQGLSRAAASYEAITGRIESRWESRADGFVLDVVIPPNTTAKIHVPASAPEAVLESERPAATAAGLSLLGYSDGAAVYEAGSGTYHFFSRR
jgi:alpha-L-rhamnosidase